MHTRHHTCPLAQKGFWASTFKFSLAQINGQADFLNTKLTLNKKWRNYPDIHKQCNRIEKKMVFKSLNTWSKNSCPSSICYNLFLASQNLCWASKSHWLIARYGKLVLKIMLVPEYFAHPSSLPYLNFAPFSGYPIPMIVSHNMLTWLLIIQNQYTISKLCIKGSCLWSTLVYLCEIYVEYSIDFFKSKLS